MKVRDERATEALWRAPSGESSLPAWRLEARACPRESDKGAPRIRAWYSRLLPPGGGRILPVRLSEDPVWRRKTPEQGLSDSPLILVLLVRGKCC